MRRISLAVLIGIIYWYIPRHWPNIQQSWDVFIICDRIIEFVWAMVLVSFIPYNQLPAKSFAAAIVVIEFFDIFLYLFWYLSIDPYLYYSAEILIGIAVYFRMWFRDYDKGNDELDDFNFFKVGIRPNSFQDFVLSLIKDPVGGVGIYVKGEFYHYRHGKLQIHDRRYLEKLASKYRIKKMRRYDNKRHEILKSLATSKYSTWSWLWNCKTVLEPILSKRGKPLFYNKGMVRER